MSSHLSSTYFRHPSAIVESGSIGKGTRVWAFAHILPGAVVGEECNICDGVFVENDVVIGDRVTIKCGVQVWDGVRLDDDVFVGPNATFTNDSFPRSKRRPEHFEKTIVRRGASIGANATILCGIEIGQNAMIGAGAVVTHNVPPNALVVGNPAVVRSYVDTPHVAADVVRAQGPAGTRSAVGVAGVDLYSLPHFRDLRGSLCVAQVPDALPFEPKRLFFVYGVPGREVRGEHAHRETHQYLICVHGECSLVVDDGFSRAEIQLDEPTIGVHIPPMVWGVQYRFSGDAVLAVAASHEYDSTDYLRSYEEYLTLVRGSQAR